MSEQDHLADGVSGLFERFAREWDADRSHRAWNDRIWHERFADALQPGAHVLDLGCGSGRPVAEALVERGFAVTGIDSSPTLIALCKQRMPQERWVVGDMRAPPVDSRYGGLLAWDSFFFLRMADQERMFATFARLCRSSAPIMFNTGPARGEAVGEYQSAPLYHASLDEHEYRALLDTHGFDVERHVANDPEAGGRTAWLARKR